MSDVRDTNHDGKLSFMEKEKSKLHHGHKADAGATTALHTSQVGAVPVVEAIPMTQFQPLVGAIPVAGVQSVTEAMPVTEAIPMMEAIPMTEAMPIAGAVPHSDAMPITPMNGIVAARDLNRDGYTIPLPDSRDLNLNGHISTTEKLAGVNHVGSQEKGDRLKLHEEQLAISKQQADAGAMDNHKRVKEEYVQQTVPLKHEELIVERIPLSGPPSPNAQIATQDEILRVPLYREEVVAEKRVVPTEEVVVRKTRVVDQQTIGDTLRSEFVAPVQVRSLDARDNLDINHDGHVSVGEKLTPAVAPEADVRAARG
jgi:uncharacterized protein (TIGR02271 family)